MIVESVADKRGWVRITCDGGCGRYVELRAKKLSRYDFYLCNSREHGRQCERALPPRIPGQIAEIAFNAAAHFTGVRHRWPSAEEAASVARAQGLLAAGMTQLAIEHARRPKQ